MLWSTYQTLYQSTGHSFLLPAYDPGCLLFSNILLAASNRKLQLTEAENGVKIYWKDSGVADGLKDTQFRGPQGLEGKS